MVQIRWRILAAIVVPLLTVIAKLRIREGSVLPAQGPFIIAPNHYSEIDPIVMGVVVWKLRRTPRFLAKASLFRVPLLGWLLRFTHQIPVQRNAGQAIGEPLKAAAELTAKGSGLIVYPEGTLTKDDDLWPMKGKSGAVRIALEAGIPLYPAAHWGTQHLMGRYGKKIRLFPRTRIDVIVGAALDLSMFEGRALTKDVVEEATALLMKEIAILLGSLRGETPPKVLHDGRGARPKR